MRLALAVLAFAIAAGGANAQSCPPPLAAAQRLVMVTADSMDTAAARLRRYTRASPTAPWQAEGEAVDALVGRKGMGWGYPFRNLARKGEPVKVEGDKRAPMGFYRIGARFGFATSDEPGYMRLQEGMVCVDDPAHPAYNTVTTRARVGKTVKGENMSRVPEYRRGILVDYPSSGRARGGSCIFIHLWLPGKTGTAGCIALQEPQLADVQDFSRDDAVLAILPRQALARFKGCLPQP